MKPWFKKRKFGWGYSPASWQGWLSTLGFIAFIAVLVRQLPYEPWVIAALILILAFTFIIFAVITSRFKPKP